MRLFFIITTLVLICTVAQAQDWEVIKSEHFLVYHLDDKDFAKSVSKRAEKYYDKIASDLGYVRHDKFWLWENRAKIYIYRSHEEFISGEGIPREWATGVARYDSKTIASYRTSGEFMDTLLPHELTHLIFRDFVGFKGKIPLWIDEGVAQWEEKFKKEQAIGIVKALIREGNFIPIGKLMKMDVRQEADFNLARGFYAQAITLVGYLIEKYGGTKFTHFCRQLRDGKSVDEALSFVYTNSIGNTGELEEKWVEYYAGR